MMNTILILAAVFLLICLALFFWWNHIRLITRLKKQSKRLEEHQARFFASIESLRVGFIITDHRTNMQDPALLAMNGAAKRILYWGKGYPKATPRTIRTLDTDAGQLSLTSYIDQSFQEKKPITIRKIPVGTRFIDVNCTPIVTLKQDTAEGGVEIIGVVTLLEDVTEATVAERSKDEFFSIASHELRTPLTAIRGNTSLIRDYYGAQLSDPELKQMIEDIHESSIRLIQIVNDFLDLARLEQKRIEFKLESVDMVALTEEVFKEMEGLFTEKRLSHAITAQAPLPAAHADRNRVKQVLLNLIGNAVKFTEIGGITVAIQNTGTHLALAVTDTGKGIPPELQALLFRKFQQGQENKLTRDGTRGTGLGLYISKLMIEGMGGEIKLTRSEPGKGTTFTCTLPVEQTA